MPTSCCIQSNADTGRVFTWMSGINRLRFNVFGFEANQRQLLDGIRAQGIEGATLLEVGSGPGYLHQTLLGEGADRATGVDLSDGMLGTAWAEAKKRGLEDRCNYRQGDFVQLADQLPDADITILDKVVCCYPDWLGLLDASLPKTRRIYALTYPRDRGMTRFGIRLMRRLLGWIHCCYQPYLHNPAQIRAHIKSNGFQLASEAQTSGWLTEVYARPTP